MGSGEYQEAPDYIENSFKELKVNVKENNSYDISTTSCLSTKEMDRMSKTTHINVTIYFRTDKSTKVIKKNSYVGTGTVCHSLMFHGSHQLHGFSVHREYKELRKPWRSAG